MVIENEFRCACGKVHRSLIDDVLIGSGVIARLPEVKGTAGTAAFILDEVTRISDAYTWTMDHTVAVDDPLELFPISMIELGE